MPGAIELQKGAQNLRNAKPGQVLFGVDDDGNPIIKDEDGNVTPSATLDGSPVSFVEQGSDPSTAANEIKVYNKQGAGMVQRAPSNGSVTGLGGGGFSPKWKGGTPGNPYVDGDTVSDAVAGDLVMVQVATGESVAMNFPTATGNPGAQIGIANIHDKKSGEAGSADLVPSAGESVGSGAVDETVNPLDPQLFGAFTFISLGTGHWHGFTFGGDLLAVALP